MLRISIIGFGLLGSSLARALKKLYAKDYTIIAYNHNQESLDKAKELGIADITTSNLEEAAKEADVFILCTPLSTYAEIIQNALPHLKDNVIISDVGSLQQYPIKTIMPLLPEKLKARFIPVHPIAGSEKSGVEAGSTELFYGKRIVVTTPQNCDPEAEATIRLLWEHTGGKTYGMEANKHDHIYAYVSHMVQIIMISYAHTKLKVPSCNPRFLRLTRYNEKMWEDIYTANKTYIQEALDAFYLAFLKNKSGALPHLISHAVMQAVPTTYLDYAGSGYQSIIDIDGNEKTSPKEDIENFIVQIERFLLNKKH